MQKEIFDELNKIADGFWNDKKALDYRKIENNAHLSVSQFSHNFDDALKKFFKIRRYDVEKGDSFIEKTLGVNPKRDFFEVCENFLEVVTMAKSYDVIIDKETPKKLEELTKQKLELEKKLSEKESIITQQKNLINTYTTQIKQVLEKYEYIKPYFGMQESEVEKND
ncbi:MAG: hypothetical protein ACE5DL_05905 [Nitrosopumilaceae archaeon]